MVSCRSCVFCSPPFLVLFGRIHAIKPNRIESNRIGDDESTALSQLELKDEKEKKEPNREGKFTPPETNSQHTTLDQITRTYPYHSIPFHSTPLHSFVGMPSRPKKKLLAESSVDPSVPILPPTRDNSNLPNSIIVHRIDPDHYATNASRSSPSSKEDDPNDTDGDNETEAEPDAEAEDRNSTHHTVRFDTAQQQTPSHNNHQLANINVSSSPQPSPSSPSAPFDFGALTKRALQEAGSGLGGAIFSACCVYVSRENKGCV